MTTPVRRWYPLAPASARVAAAAAAAPIDPLEGPPLALAGRVVTMDDGFAVRNDAVIYVNKGAIVAIQERAEAPPQGFEEVPVTGTGGTIFPGLIELHNHLSYNALPLWSPVPKLFSNRDQWGGGQVDDYRRLVSGPMRVVGETPSLLPSLVRYVEAKCLLGGVTTSQGIKLASNAGVGRFYRGLIRNAEQTNEPDLPEATTRIADVAATGAREFLDLVEKANGHHCLLLHLSEGKDEAARKHFLALEVKPGTWAIGDSLAGIHSAALQADDFRILAQHGGSMVWSPLSNLLLYGDTADIKAAKAAGVMMALGSDWSPSGSKNLLGELKVAWLVSESLGGVFPGRELVAMATRNAAKILKWTKVLGSLEPRKRADLVVIDGSAGDPYDALIRAKETAILLVMINGVPRYGIPSLMDACAPGGTQVQVGGKARKLFLKQATADPDVAQVSLTTATTTLRTALKEIGKLAKKLEKPAPAVRAAAILDRPQPVVWTLALDELHDTGVDLRPHLPFAGPKDFTGPSRVLRAGAVTKPLSQVLGPIRLDPLTVADDDQYLPSLAGQKNLPEAVKGALAALY